MKKKAVILILLFLSLMVTGYAAEMKLTPVKDYTKRISSDGLSILPPQEDGWYIIENHPTGGLNFKKILDKPEHTLVCQLVIVPVNQQFKNTDDFMQFVKQAMDAESNPKRFKDAGSNYKLDKKFGEFSLEYQANARDMDRKASDGTNLIMKLHGYAFIYPDLPGYIFFISYSEKSVDQEFSPSFQKLGDEFIDNLIIKRIEKKQEQAEPTNENNAQRGNRYFAEGKYAEAISEYRKSLKVNPDDAIDNYNLGYSYLKLGKYKDAIRYHKKASQINPHDHDTYSQMGFAYLQLGQHEKAVENYEKAFQIDPNNAGTCSDIGVAYTYLKKYEEAFKYYEKALQIDPNYLNAYNNIGYLYTQLGQHEKAIKYYEKVTQIDPNDAFGQNNLGFSYANLGQYEKAVKYYEKALQLDPNYSVARNNLRNTYRKLGKHK